MMVRRCVLMLNYPSRTAGVVGRWLIRAVGLLMLGLSPLLQGADDPNPVQLQLSAPLSGEVYQRSTLDQGAIVLAGQWSVVKRTGPLPEALEARVVPPGADADDQVPWTPLPFDPRARGFRAELSVAPGGWYRVQLRLLRAGEVVASADVAQVGVGEVFVIAGQSNSANYGEERQQPTTGLVTAFDGERWVPANDPQPGATGTKGSFIPSFGDALARRLKVPIGVVCLGVGSTSVREWMPANYPMSAPPTTGAHCVVIAPGKLVSSGELFDRLALRLRQFPAQGVRAVLWHQGESDWKQPEGHNLSLAEYREDLVQLITSTRTMAGWSVPWFVAQASYGNPEQPGSEKFRQQQRAVVDGKLTLAGPNTDTLTGELREKQGQGVHFSAAGLKRHGELWAQIVGDWIAGTGWR